MFFEICDKLPSFLIFCKWHFTVSNFDNRFLILFILNIDFPPGKKCTGSMRILVTTLWGMNKTIACVTKTTFMILIIVMIFGWFESYPTFLHGPTIVHQHTENMYFLGRRCRNTEKSFQPTVVAFIASWFEIGVGFFEITILTKYILFLPGIGIDNIIGWKPSIARSMEPDKALLAVGKTIILFIIWTTTPKTGRMEHILAFSTLFIFLLLHKLLEFPLISYCGLSSRTML